MDTVIDGFLQRNIPQLKSSFDFIITGSTPDSFAVTAENGRVQITASNYIAAFNGFYNYLKKYCGIQLSWCGNNKINISTLTMFDGVFSKTIEQKFRVYMNYCTLDYTMCWWDFDRWEKEIDFMAMNSINMPLAVVGTEAVWYETLLELGFTKEEALNSVSGPAFWAWQLMTNIEGYLPPKDEKYIYERLELGQKILNRYIEFGMQPIQQGFSGHVPALLSKKFPKAKILMQRGWCYYPKTAQLDPLDPLFKKFGTIYLEKLETLLGNYHYLACDPFHEGTPPKPWKKYLQSVGKAINNLYEDFDRESVWVMQAWTMREHIARAVPKDRLLILDLNSEKTQKFNNMWGYPVVSGMLHNFGGKNSMQGKLEKHCENKYKLLQGNGANVLGSGMFMEGIEQNPVIYELQFELLTAGDKIDCRSWLKDYITRRYGEYDNALMQAWNILLETCYKSDGYEENAVGSCLASRPQLIPVMTGPCCYAKVYYDTKKFEKAVSLFLSVHEQFKTSDGYQYDLCDLVRQALSNRFHDTQLQFATEYQHKNLPEVKRLADLQRQLLTDLDGFLSHRSEMSLSRWINASHNLATDGEERKYFDLNARTLITSWGNIDGDTSALYDYSWREWSGLIGEYYLVRWSRFYDEAVSCLESGKKLVIKNGNGYAGRKLYRSYSFGKELNQFELEWCKTYSEYPPAESSDVILPALELCKKWHI